MLLNVEYDPSGEVIINMDQEGFDTLKWNLSHMENKPDHVHMFSPAWGGYELTEAEPMPGCLIINKLTLRKVISASSTSEMK